MDRLFSALSSVLSEILPSSPWTSYTHMAATSVGASEKQASMDFIFCFFFFFCNPKILELTAFFIFQGNYPYPKAPSGGRSLSTPLLRDGFL